MSDQYKTMFESAVSALAAIDRELDMPEDGCNSPAATLAAIRDLKRRASPVQHEGADAARYDWLRQKRAIEPVTLAGYPWPVHVVTEYGIPTIVPCVEGELDRMIDAAIEKERANSQRGEQ